MELLTRDSLRIVHVEDIRALTKINPLIKIIAASGLNIDGSDAKISGTGVKYFLGKPFTAEILLKTMRAILEEP